MKFVLAPDSFKESMTAAEAVAAMERGIRSVFPDAECIAAPMADGGEGTAAALLAALGGTLVSARVQDALGRGARRFIVGLGGSVTNDGGAGMLQALGARLLDRNGNELAGGGAALSRLARIDLAGLDPRLAGATFRIASDVTNPLLGPDGASRVFGPQKGADEETGVCSLAEALATGPANLERAVAMTCRMRMVWTAARK